MTLMVGRTQATLFDRGNGLVFDDFDHLSWTQNAAISGLNDWASQKVFADDLVGGHLSFEVIDVKVDAIPGE